MVTIQSATPLEAVLRRDRTIVLGGLVGVTLLAWLYTAYLAKDLSHAATVQPGVVVAHIHATNLLLLFVMWVVMMVAMMIPSAAQMILTFATISRKQEADGEPFLPTAAFLTGYVIAWSGYSAVAALAQWWLHRGDLVSAIGVSTSTIFSGVVLLVAGIFQWTPLKYACLAHCRSPLGFLLTRWRSGSRGALAMGLEHGSYCVVCCWALMALMFVAGTMNLLWLAAIAAFVFLEKLAPKGHLVGHVAGVTFVLWGLYLLLLGFEM
jgi:predicted metal-binding membrane protein